MPIREFTKNEIIDKYFDGQIKPKDLRKFKQKVARDGVPSECKKRECYDKPGVKRRNAKKEGIKNSRKRNRANRDN